MSYAADLLLTNNCPVQAPCSCTYGNDIDCNSKLLRQIPTIRPVPIARSHSWTIDLANNSMSSIPSNVFSNTQTLSDGNIFLDLSQNNLNDTSFETNAFDGIENLLTELSLSNNQITSVPMVISKLNFLRTLLLLDNPIKTIDPNVFTPIWQTLTTLHISLSGAQKWPVAFRQLSSVRDFYVEDFHQGPPLDAFYGFEDTLQTLRLSKTPWFFCPTNFFTDCSCYLAQIYLRPTMPYSMIVGRSSSRFPACRSPLMPIRTVELLAINYNQFPSMFEMCPNLQKIRITQSNITFIDDFLIPENTSLVILSIQDSKLWTVPSCVNKFPLLQECYFDGNRIHTVEMHAFNNL